MTVGCKSPPIDSPGNSPEWIQHRWYKESVSQSVDMDCCHLWMHTMMIPPRSSVYRSLLVCWHSVQKKHLTDCRECTSSPLHQLVHMMLQKGIKHWNYWLPRMHLSASQDQFKHLVQYGVRSPPKFIVWRLNSSFKFVLDFYSRIENFALFLQMSLHWKTFLHSSFIFLTLLAVYFQLASSNYTCRVMSNSTLKIFNTTSEFLFTL